MVALVTELGFGVPPESNANSPLVAGEETSKLSWLKMQPQQPSSDDSESQGTILDVIHVTALCPSDRLHKFGAHLSDMVSQKRDFVARVDMASLLMGNLTQKSIDEQAVRLLQELLILEEESNTKSRRAIMFVAYDLGALIVKTALSLSVRSKKTYEQVFWLTSHILFWGCPQRALDIAVLESKLQAFLSAKQDESWQHLLTMNSVCNLACSVRQSNEAFIDSKICLRSRIISFSAGDEESHGTIDPVFDKFTATLGVPSEILIQEKKGILEKEPFPGLIEYLSSIPAYWFPHPEWIPIKKVLLTLSSSYCPYRTTSLEPPPALVFESSAYQTWYNFSGTDILYMHGTTFGVAQEIANQTIFSWQAKRLAQGQGPLRVLSFVFNSADPFCNSIPHMMASVLFQGLVGESTAALGEEYCILRQMFLFNGGWSQQSCISLLMAMRFAVFGANTILLLHDFDECDRHSRTVFLSACRKLSQRSEYPLRLLITSRKPGVLLEELRGWPELSVDTVPIAVADNTQDETDHLTNSCPVPSQKAQIRLCVTKLAATNENWPDILKMLRSHTGWPENTSPESLAQFVGLLDMVNSQDTPEMVLDKILRSTPDVKGFRWVFSWLLCSYRPLTPRELSTILYHHTTQQELKSESGQSPYLTILRTKEVERQLASWLRGLADSSNGRVIIRHETLALLKEDTETEQYIWNEVKRTAHHTIAKFCANYLDLTSTQYRLTTILQQYESEDAREMTAPLASDGEDLIFYVVQSFPYHMSKLGMDDPINFLWCGPQDPANQSLNLWAKAYWSMSNPFVRSQKAPVSYVSTLVGLGLLPYGNVEKPSDVLYQQCLIAVAGHGAGKGLSHFLEQQSFPTEVLTDAIVASMQAGNEAAATQIAEAALLPYQESGSVPQWHESAIWLATWLNMDRLLEALLTGGMSCDIGASTLDKNTDLIPSPLYLASILGHATVVSVLLKHGANPEVRSRGQFNCLHAAAKGGSVEVVYHLSRYPKLLDSKNLLSPLVTAARVGSWTATEALLKLSLDPNVSQGDSPESPLLASCRLGFPRTTEALLQGGSAPDGLDVEQENTPLWAAAIVAGSVECIRVLVAHGANLYSERLQQPLLTGLAEYSKDIDTTMRICKEIFSEETPVRVDDATEDDETALIIASGNKALQFVRWLLENGANINAQDRSKRTPLYEAVVANDADMVKELLKWNPDLEIVNECTDSNLTILQEGLENTEIVKLLLDAGANPNQVDRLEIASAFNAAVVRGKREVVQMFIENKADIRQPDSTGWTPLCDAVAYTRSAEMARLLIEAKLAQGYKLDDVASGYNLLQLAVNGPPEIVQMLLQYRKHLDSSVFDSTQTTPLLTAGPVSRYESLELLVHAGVNVNAVNSFGYTALHNSARHNLPRFRDLLLSQEDIIVNPTQAPRGGPLQIACTTLAMDHVVAFLDHGADIHAVTPDVIHTTPLIAALISGNERSEDTAKIDQIVRMLVSRGADIGIKLPGCIFHSALAAACLGAGVETINFLIDEGALPHLTDPLTGRVPLHLAAANGIENFDAILARYKEDDFMAPDKSGKNCLHWAAQYGKLKTVKRILSRVSNISHYINLAEHDGWTPLCWATRPPQNESYPGAMCSEPSDFEGVVRTLLQHGADRFVKCRLGLGKAIETLTPHDLAQRCNAGQTITNMLKYGPEGRPEPGQKQIDESSLGRLKLYSMHKSTCDVCFTALIGLDYSCTTCPDYDVCTKCMTSVPIFHNKASAEHPVELDPSYTEYQELEEEDEIVEEEEARVLEDNDVALSSADGPQDGGQERSDLDLELEIDYANDGVDDELSLGI